MHLGIETFHGSLVSCVNSSESYFTTPMAGSRSDFVLDDDLDEDEEILQIHSEQLPRSVAEQTSLDKNVLIPDSLREGNQASTENASGLESDKSPGTEPNQALFSPSTAPTSGPEPGSTSERVRTNARRNKTAQPTAVIIDGLPISTTRADLDALLGASASSITNVRLRRLEQHGLLRVRVQFDSENVVDATLEKDGTKFKEDYVSIKPASYERWDAAAATSDAPRMRPRMQKDNGSRAHNSNLVNLPEHNAAVGMPDLNSVTKTFWSAFGAARQTAEKLEKRARELGQKLEDQLHVSEKVEAGKVRMHEIDRDLNVSRKVSDFAQASRETALAVDGKLHITEGVNHVVGNVSEAARIVAREVDENLRLSDKAREATNAALSSPTVGGVARKVVSRADGSTPTSKKKYHPRRLDLDDVGSAMNASGGTADGVMVTSEERFVEGEASENNHDADGASEMDQNTSK